MQLCNSNNRSTKNEDTEQKQLYEKCMNVFRFLGLLCGVRITYKWKPYTHLAFFWANFLLIFAFFSIFYTVYIHCVNGDYIKALEPLAVSGIIASVVMKWIAYQIHWKQMLALLFSMRKFFRPNVSGRQEEIIKLSLRNTWRFLWVFLVGVSAAVLFFASVPIVVYLKTKAVIPLVPVEILFCDQWQTSGFIAAAFVHLIFGFYSGLATIIYGSTIIFCISNYTFQVNLIAEDFRQLDRMWDGKNNISLEYKHAFLNNICKKRQDMNDYFNKLKYVFETKLFLYFCSNYFSLIICLYDITQNGYIGGYAPAFVQFVEMMFYCYWGTQLSIVDDKVCDCIYMSKWHTYDLESQRMVQMLLHDAQQPRELQLGTIGPLNLVTGIAIVKSIYSYYTVMTELF